MSGFADAAARLAGLSAVLMGWRPNDFWAATPAELGGIFAALNRPPEPGAERAPDPDTLARLKEMWPDD